MFGFNAITAVAKITVNSVNNTDERKELFSQYCPKCKQQGAGRFLECFTGGFNPRCGLAKCCAITDKLFGGWCKNVGSGFV